jgi:long-chain fatty acid transport protein
MRWLARSVLFASLGIPALLSAQGFAVNELGTCAMGRAGTAAAGPCRDGSGIWANPAALAGLPGTHISASGTLILPHGGFTDDLFAVKTDMPSQSYLVPSVYLTHQAGKLGFGVGVFAPYGLGTKWCQGDPCEPLDFIGRFDGYNTQIRSIYVQPTVAYQVNDWLSLGFGVAYVHSTLELHQRVDLSLQALPTNPFLPAGTTFATIGIPSFTDFADVTLKASGNGIAFNGGILVKVSDRLTLGGHFITKKTIKYKGNAAFAQVPTGLVIATATTPLNPTTPLPIDLAVAPQFVTGGPLVDQSATTAVTLPDQGTIGFAYKASDKWTVMGDYQQIVWGWLQAITIDFSNALTPDRLLPEGFKDSHAIRVGVEYQYNAKTTIRGGYLYHTPAAPVQTVTPLLPEGARNEFTIGFGTELVKGMRVDAAYQLIIQQDRRGRAGTTFNNGLYTFGAHLLGAGLSYTF